MVDYSLYMNAARARYVPTYVFYVQLPPTKTDCTCISQASTQLSMMNAPIDYCDVCDNKGYIETKVEHEVTGTMVDFVGDTLNSNVALTEDQASMFNNQRYVLHAAYADCTSDLYCQQICFDLAKEVRISNDNYKILTVDKSTLLGQIKVVVSKKN